ncbi:Uncharacterised protein [Mycobacteroides abscessus subsp. abscessus]|nr:Uncharacterised protein [Mycobacteroides abscessus subsp. abscessus]
MPRQVPAAKTLDWSCVAALPVVGSGAPVLAENCRPQRSVRSPFFQPSGLGYIRPTT